MVINDPRDLATCKHIDEGQIMQVFVFQGKIAYPVINYSLHLLKEACHQHITTKALDGVASMIFFLVSEELILRGRH